MSVGDETDERWEPDIWDEKKRAVEERQERHEEADVREG